MKHTILYILLPMLALLLTACNRELDSTVPDTSGAEGLRIQAVKLGFLEEDGKTRAVTDDATMRTTFEEGDAIGLFIKSTEDGSMIQQNVKYTKQADGSWSGAPLKYDPKAYYFAYSPYRDVAAINNATSTDGIVAGFDVNYDQRTKEGYAANDLMISHTCEASTESLLIYFKHALTLLEISTSLHCKSGNFRYSIKGSELIGATLKPEEESLYGFLVPSSVPEVASVRRYLLKDPNNISCTFALNKGDGTHIKRELFNSNSPHIGSAGKRIKFKPYQTRDIQIGDYYYSDGSIYPGDGASPFTVAQGCIGVVYKVGAGVKDIIDNYSDTGLQGAIHGYVIAAGKAKEDNHSLAWATVDNRNYYVGTFKSQTTFEGYTDTRLIQTMSEKVKDKCEYPACFAAVNYPVTAPSNSSGWYLPSAGQATEAITQGKFIITNLERVGYTTSNGTFFWTTTENGNNQGQAYLFSGDLNDVYSFIKTDQYNVCPFLTF